MTKQHHSDEILSAYLDHDLEPQLAEEVGRHLEECPECRKVLEELTAVRDAARSLEQLEPSESTWYEIQQRTRKRARPRLAWVWTGVAAAAAVVLVVFLVGRRPAGAPEPEEFAELPSSREKVEAGLVQEYEDYLCGLEAAIEECEAALSENPHNPRVRMAYLEARSSRVKALDMLVCGGD